MQDDTFKVSEIFRSIQGEGVSAGCPCLFVRLATCNLRCTWCDTRYSWDFANHDYATEVRRLTSSELYQAIVDSGESRLVFTGGEPLLQQNLLARLLGQLPTRLYIEVETNGTLAPAPELERRVDQWNVSPKLANSGEPRARRLRTEALEHLRRTERAWLKLVVATKSDCEEAKALANELNWPPDRVLLMPEAQHADELVRRGPGVASACSEFGLRYSPRLHLALYGGQRGH
jgi:7-carboxy-7-deazaguanine synthase